MANVSKIVELERLQKLKEDGILSDAEFEKMKQEILSGNDVVPTEPEPEIINETTVDEVPVTTEVLEAPKKKNMALIGFGIAVVVVTLIFIVVVLFLSGGKGKDENKNIVTEASATQETVQTETKSDFLTSISGVWADQGGLISIVYKDNQLQYWIGDFQEEVKLGEVDLTNETVNLILNAQEEDGYDRYEGIVTLKKKWNQDKTAFDLVMTEVGSTELKLVRKISNDDLNRFARLEKEQAQRIADSKALSVEELKYVATNYVEQALNTASVKNLMPYYASVVSYYGKKEVPIATVSKDKTAYLNKWKNRTAALSGEISFSDGSKVSQKIATYTYEFTVSNDTEEITGSSIRYITFEKVEGTIFVVGENGKVTSSNVTKLNEPEKVPEYKPATYSGSNN